MLYLVVMQEMQIQNLMDRFDTSGDGNMDINDFLSFLDDECSNQDGSEKFNRTYHCKSTNTIAAPKDSMKKDDKTSYLKLPVSPGASSLHQKNLRPKSAPARRKVFGHFDDYNPMQLTGKQKSDHLGGCLYDDRVEKTSWEEKLNDPHHLMSAEYSPTFRQADLNFGKIRAGIRAQKNLQKKLGEDYYIQ